MDRNQLMGLLLMFLLLTIYFQYIAEPPKSPEKKEQAQRLNISQQIAKKAEQNKQALKDSAKTAKEFGQFATAMQGNATPIIMENQKVKITLSTLGGRVQEVMLKKYNGLDAKPLVLNNAQSTSQSFELKTLDRQAIDLYTLYYETAEPKKEDGKTTLRFVAKVGEGKVIQTYTLPKDGYVLDYDIKLEGLDKTVNTEALATFNWQDKLRRFEEDLYQTRYYTTINFLTEKGEFDYLAYPSEDIQQRKPDMRLHWVSFKQRFFTQAFIAKNKNLRNASFVKSGSDINDAVIKDLEATLEIPTADLLAGKGQFSYYYGPNQYQTLTNTKIDNFGRNVYLGWDMFGFFAAWMVIPIFALLENVTSNYGLVIILLVLIFKVLVLPLTYRSNKAMAKMKVVNELTKPELDEFKAKNDLSGSFLSMEQQQKVNQEQMRLSQQLGVSPFAAMGGCLPMVLQMPIFIAMFLFVPGAVELRGEAFLWAHDLSTYDAILRFPYVWGIGSHLSLFTLLMTLSTLALTYYTSLSQPSMQGPNKYIGYIMPVMFIFVLNSSPAALSLYYLVQNIVSIVQQQVIQTYFIDDSKIILGYEAYKKENKDKVSGKTKMQLWLEDAQKKAQERSEAKRKQIKKPKS